MKYSANSSDVTSISLEENNCRSEFIRTQSKTKPLCANLSHLQSNFTHET